MFKNFLKIAFRNASRNKGFSFINIAGLTLGLSACLLIGLFVLDEKQFDEFIPEGNRVYRIYLERTDNEGTENNAGTPPMFATTLQQEFPEVEKTLRIMKIQSRDLFETGNKKLYETGGIAPDATFFDIFPLAFTYGSPVKALDDHSSIVLSQDMSERYFGKEDPVGKEILFNKKPYQVKGVFQNNPRFHLQLNYIIPLASLEIPAERMQSWRWQQFYSYVKLKAGSDEKEAESKFQTFIKQKVHPLIKEGSSVYLPFFQALEDIHLFSADFKFDLLTVRGNISYVNALSIIAVFILLIACFNFVNLATARSIQRAKEVGVRKTIGASRKQLMVQFLGETILLAFISTVISVILTFILLPWLNDFTEKQITFNLFTDPLILPILLVLILVVGTLAGFYPALLLSGFKAVKVLKSGSASDAMPGRVSLLRHGLVIVQFTLSVLLIISTIVIISQVNYLHHKDLGLNKDQIMFFPMRGDNMFKNYETFKDELLTSPGVSSVSIGYGFPGDMVAGDNIIVANKRETKSQYATQLLVDHDYIETLGLQLLAGRDFSKEIKTDKDEAFIINETAVKNLGFGTPENALGKILQWPVWGAQRSDSLKRGQVIGVVKDFHYKSLYDQVETTVLQIFPDAYWKVAVKIKGINITTSVNHVKSIWSRFSPDYPIEYIFLDESFTQMYKAEDKLKSLLWIFTAITILVACLGLLGLATYAAERRRKEIGIRKVLGATVNGIILLLSKDFVKLVGISLLIASPIGWYLMHQWLHHFAYRINISFWIFLVAGTLAIFIAFITVAFQAFRAAIANPVKNLRTE